MFPHGLVYLNTWLPTGGAFKEVMEPLGVALLGENTSLGTGLGVYSLVPFSVDSFCFLCAKM